MEKNKLDITLSDKAKKEIEEIRILSGCKSIGETIRRSLALMKLLSTEKIKGGEIVIRNKYNNTEKVLLSFK